MNQPEQLADLLQKTIDGIQPNLVIHNCKYYTLRYLQDAFAANGVDISPSWWRTVIREGRLKSGKIQRTTVVSVEDWQLFIIQGGFYRAGRANRTVREVQYHEGLSKLNFNLKTA